MLSRAGMVREGSSGCRTPYSSLVMSDSSIDLKAHGPERVVQVVAHLGDGVQAAGQGGRMPGTVMSKSGSRPRRPSASAPAPLGLQQLRQLGLRPGSRPCPSPAAWLTSSRGSSFSRPRQRRPACPAGQALDLLQLGLHCLTAAMRSSALLAADVLSFSFISVPPFNRI